MMHGCTIGDGSLIGISSVILNGVRIGKNCIIGAKALIPEGKEIPDNSLVLGAPAKVVKTVTAEQAAKAAYGAAHYIDNWRRHRAGLRPDD
jgi:carbonic anhydrase/acetyltransferase-like protein (isoleucine patch superfamily)